MDEFIEKEFGTEVCQLIELLSPSMDDYLYIYDFQNDFYYISPQALKRFLIPSNYFNHVLENHTKFVYPDDLPALQKELTELRISDRVNHDMIYRWLSIDSEPIWINCRGRVVRRDGMALYLVGCINEIGTRHIADNNSGLLGGSSFQKFVDANIDAATKGYLLRLGVDDLKGLNVRLGIEYGDMILRRSAECIAECIRPGQKLYRIIGDEFIVLDYLGGTREDAQALYRQIRGRIDGFVAQNNYEAVYTLSGGIVCFHDMEDHSYSNIMKVTEFALEEAKRQGRNRCYTFHEEQYRQFLRKRELMLRLRQAVNMDFKGFEVYFQPIFHMDSGRIYGAEALMRFYTQGFGAVSPAEFIPILEETGLIIPAGRWILREALDACGDFQKYIPDFHININLSNVQIMKSNVGGEILKAVAAAGIAPGCVTIELTESGFLENDYRFSNMWKKMKEAGLLLALDDFGTGYSNFHYITELQPDTIKIDRTFTVEALRDSFEYELLALFTKMSHDLKLKVCIEGIETEEERNAVSRLLPDYIQGFYYGKPCVRGDFERNFLEKE